VSTGEEQARWRLGDADREQLYDLLARHAAAGRLDNDELERRVAIVAEAQTHEQAAAATADLPPLAADAPESGRPRWWRGHGESDAPAAGWRATSERFRDPRTRRVMRVWIDAGGGRHYVPDDQV
jgi:Domain of unknown function (DUF1707)